MSTPRPSRARSPRAQGVAGRTGARSTPPLPPEEGDAEGRAATVYRGIRWQRNPAGRLRWHDDDRDRWVLWKPGQDAPPRPPAWVSSEPEPLGTPLRDRRARAGWRSPFRLVPIVLVVLVVIFGVVQATRDKSSSVATLEKAAAEKLVGQCLVADGTADGRPRYDAGSVACTSPRASVKVIEVVSGTGPSTCPKGTTTVQIAYPGVAHPHRECVRPVVH
jgi:hypothetical protein